MSVLGFACVLLPYSCSALHEYTRKQISFPAPNGDCGSVLRGRFSLRRMVLIWSSYAEAALVGRATDAAAWHSNSLVNLGQLLALRSESQGELAYDSP